jgi:small conductance mechanosensitive channel
MNLQEFIEKALSWFFSSGIQIILTLILVIIGLKLARGLSRKLVTSVTKHQDDIEVQKRTETLGSVIKHLLTILILIVGAMMIMKELGIEIGPVLAAAGIVGLAVGFGAQNLVQDVISGFFILLEDQIRVGDVVKIAGQGGLVEKVNLRMTVIRDLWGNVHYVRNGNIDIITNLTKEYSRYVFEIGVAYRENIDAVMDVLKKIDEELRDDPAFKDDILEPIEIFGLDQFGDSAIIIKARYKTKTMQQWRIGREFNRRMKITFDELDIEIPFPHRTIYMGQDKQGQSAPLNVNLKEQELSQKS